jgi:hypothetical protein
MCKFFPGLILGKELSPSNSGQRIQAVRCFGETVKLCVIPNQIHYYSFHASQCFTFKLLSDWAFPVTVFTA